MVLAASVAAATKTANLRAIWTSSPLSRTTAIRCRGGSRCCGRSGRSYRALRHHRRRRDRRHWRSATRDERRAGRAEDRDREHSAPLHGLVSIKIKEIKFWPLRALIAEMNFFPSVNYFTPLDRFLNYLPAWTDEPSMGEMSIKRLVVHQSAKMSLL
jgi:hypothetical protein